MKLYKHYKGKYYTFREIVKHSETLEELVLYDTRYENAEGRAWVRPKKMFFEKVVIDGKTLLRFEEIPLAVKTISSITAHEIQIIESISKPVLGNWDTPKFMARLKAHAKFHLFLGCVEDKPVGFKLGYERDGSTFYSWLGGVLHEYRGLGIASDLMREQHRWCIEQGYSKVQTKTENRFKDMLLLNIKHGFDVMGTEVSDRGVLKTLLEKRF
ncbi:MAG: GNAT family N-acetyltransferase [Oligoflexales bacterium]